MESIYFAAVQEFIKNAGARHIKYAADGIFLYIALNLLDNFPDNGIIGRGGYTKYTPPYLYNTSTRQKSAWAAPICILE